MTDAFGERANQRGRVGQRGGAPSQLPAFGGGYSALGFSPLNSMCFITSTSVVRSPQLRKQPAEGRILEILRVQSRPPWLKLSWLQRLRWVRNVEAAWHGNPAAAEAALESADAMWGEVQTRRILFQARFNLVTTFGPG